jgi:hypothetical protein
MRPFADRSFLPQSPDFDFKAPSHQDTLRKTPASLQVVSRETSFHARREAIALESCSTDPSNENNHVLHGEQRLSFTSFFACLNLKAVQFETTFQDKLSRTPASSFQAKSVRCLGGCRFASSGLSQLSSRP